MATISSRKADLGYRLYGVSAKARRPLLDWMIGALEAAGCRMLRVSEAREAPFRLTFETAMGERMGVLAYAFFANSEPTKNRPPDEHRFQIKYGKKTGGLHEIWSDPYALYTTLFFGINLEQGFFVGADPARHNPTRHFISLEYKEHQVQEILRRGWHAWQREKRESGRYGFDLPVEVLVGGRSEHFLRFIRFERAAQGLDAGHRELLAEEVARDPSLIEADVPAGTGPVPSIEVPHALIEELGLSSAAILDLIASAPRLKMAVRGWVAEAHLYDQLVKLPGVEDCQRIETEGGADLRLRYCGSAPFEIECKNILRERAADGTMRVDFQRTRASKKDPCSRFYSPKDFDLVAACLHSCTKTWAFRYALPSALDRHRKCPGKLSNLVRLDERWTGNVELALAAASRAA